MRLNDRNLHRVIAFLNREEIDYLDTIGKDSLFTTGTKLSRIKTLRAMIEAMRELGVNGRGIKSEDALKNEILKKVSSYKEGMMRLADKAKDIILIALVALGITLGPIATAYCAPRSVSKTITLRLTVVPKAELRVDEKRMSADAISLDSRNLSKVLAKSDKEVRVEKLMRNGVETLVLTKVVD